MKKTTYVVGHKNPDTDSICSAIAYAYLKNKTCGEEDYKPFRAGRVNEETRYVLERFQVSEPDFLADVGTQVRDIKIREVAGIPRNSSLKQAWYLMREAGVVTLPITSGKELLGLITIQDIVTSYMDVYDSKILSMSETPYKNVMETLDASLIVGDEHEMIRQGKIVVAAGSPEILEEFVEEGDIVIVSNRYEAQLCSIEMDAGCIIICNGTPVSKTIKRLAAERGCSVLSTKHDTYSVSRLINQSAPVEHFMRKAPDLVTFRTDDFIDDIKRVMAEKQYRDFPVLDIHGNYRGMLSRRFLLNAGKKQVILVDHNEKTQAVDGLEEAEILEIIDHHRLGSLETLSPVLFRNQPVGSTASIVGQMYKEQGVAIPKDMAGILCCAILSDTLMFRSPTCTQADREQAQLLAEIAGIHMEDCGREMLQAGSSLGDKSAEEIFYHDYKKFTIKGIHFGVGQISSMSGDELAALKDKLLPYMEKTCMEQGLDMTFFMLTDIMEEETELIYAGKGAEEIISRAYMEAPREGSFILKDLISRKKQLIPAILSGMEE